MALVTAVRDELRATGNFDAERVVRRAGCAPATYYAHLSTKDDALGAAFELVLDDLVELVARRVGGEGPDDLDRFCAVLVADLVDFFRTENLVFRAALARLGEHRGIRRCYREAERETVANLAGFFRRAQAVGGVTTAAGADMLAEAVLVLCQGLNNPRLLGPEPPSEVLGALSRAMAALLRPGGR
jgi:AcrR family transcriptional regulator